MTDEIKILNAHQVVFYLDRGIEPLRLEKGYKDKLVFVYDKAKTLSAFKEWKDHCKEWKANLHE